MGVLDGFKEACPDSYAYLLKTALEESSTSFTLSFLLYMADALKPEMLLSYAGELTYDVLRAHQRITELEAQLKEVKK
jgi:hypothetical protein